MKNYIIVIQLFLLVLASCAGTRNNTYFVRTDGNDNNNGTSNSPEKAWKTIDTAFARLSPGDQLYINDGLYTVGVLTLKNIHGSSDKITRISAVNKWKTKLTQQFKPEDDHSVVTISNCSYVEISGFEVFDTIDTGIGISVRDSSHHVVVKDNYVHDCGCNGISSRLSDYLVFEGNVVRGNATRNKWNCSGISIWHPVQYDNKAGYHLEIKRNVAFDNECNLPFTPLGYDTPTDGNGIIIDDFMNTQGGGQAGGYHAPVLIENNLCFNNGGRGISVYRGHQVDIVNNTTFHNLRIISNYADFPGDMTVANANGCKIYNNLIVKNPNLPTKALRCYDNDSTGTKIYNNLIVGEKDFCEQTLFDSNNIYLDYQQQDFPAFRNAPALVEFSEINDFYNYFGLRSSSPAIDAGTNDNAPKIDLNKIQRPYNEKTDIGCYEWTP